MAAAPIRAGTNACYAENVSRVKTLPVGYKSNGPLMLINTEWGNFSSPVLPRLDEDLCAFSATRKPFVLISETLLWRCIRGYRRKVDRVALSCLVRWRYWLLVSA